MLLHGVPTDTVAVLRRVSSLARNWGAQFAATRLLSAGSSIEHRDRSLRVIPAPGHSPTDTLFLDEARGILFGGDHLLAEISSNALISRDLANTSASGRFARRRALVEYMASLQATRELEIGLVLGGHGPPFSDHRALIDKRLARYEERAEQILAIVRERTRSAHEITDVIWGEIAITDAFLTLSEVLGHVDLLIADELVVEHRRASGSVAYGRG
jgi:glyoxylase-like metal-dependent hydrolase (beta-lactamase superfamily II)